MVSKPSLKQVHEKWRLEAFEIVKKKNNNNQKNQATISSSQNFVQRYKSLTGGLDDYIFFWIK